MDEPEGIGDRFQQETKHERRRLVGGRMDWASKPPLYKEYPAARQIPLPPPGKTVHASFLEIAARRRSVREYSSHPLQRGEISLLLWASTGIQRIEGAYAFRTVPSAGALYPIDTYVIAHRVEGVEGVYHYGVRVISSRRLPGGLPGGPPRAALSQVLLRGGSRLCLDGDLSAREMEIRTAGLPVRVPRCGTHRAEPCACGGRAGARKLPDSRLFRRRDERAPRGGRHGRERHLPELRGTSSLTGARNGLRSEGREAFPVRPERLLVEQDEADEGRRPLLLRQKRRNG